MRAWLSVLLVALSPLTAGAAECGLAPHSVEPAEITPLESLPEGIVRGRGICDGFDRPMAVWTLPVDPEQEDLGIRDRPLFRSVPANPLVAVTEAAVGADARIAIFRRQRSPAASAEAPDRRPPHRLFGTYCDAGSAEPLDCGANGARIKMRADVVDSDGDGALDQVRHQISIWDGAERLQVLMFDTRHAGRPLGNAVPWIEALRLAGRL